jgi:putative ABC transport system permease protein
MKYFAFVWATLWRRKMRTWFTLLSIVTAFFLFGILQGFNLGISGIYDFLGTARLQTMGRMNNSPMPLAHMQQIAAVPGVTAVTPITAVPGTYQEPGNRLEILGVDIAAWFTVYPEYKMPAASLAAMARTRNGIVVGFAVAEKYGWQIGDRVPVQAPGVPRSDGSPSWEFEIVGIYNLLRGPSWATRVFANFDYINEARASGRDMVVQYISRIAEPERYAEVATIVDELFANSASQTLTRSEEDFVRVLLAQVGNISYLLNGIVAAVLFTLLFLTANTMMLSVRERIPELAALKTLGFTDVALLCMVLAEVLLLCVVAGGIGLGAAAIIFPQLMSAMGPSVGLEGLRIPILVYGYGSGIAAMVALVSGLPPALRAMHLNIVDGLANR